tara:strand:+ start:172 stop:468 length:297 start_codon:yes stop_codon:yes gene_type:complete
MQEIEIFIWSGELAHCPLCGMKSIVDNEIQVCDHLVYVTTDESSEPDYDKDNLFKEMNDEETQVEYLRNNLSDEFLCIGLFIPAPSGFGAYHIYKLRE